MSLHDDIVSLGEKALEASRKLNLLDTDKKNSILLAMANGIENHRDKIKEANQEDIENGKRAGLASAMLDRLLLNDNRLDGMISGLRKVAKLDDPVGSDIKRWKTPNGLEIIKRRVPIGVIGIIYESRPNVTADTSALCIKTSNAIILRGGKEAIHSNKAIADVLNEAGSKVGLPLNAIQLVETTDREAVRELVQLDGILDLIIPRGGETLIRAVSAMSRVPVIKHYKGVCHTYVDDSANLKMALQIAENAKCQRPGVCNAMETLIVHENISQKFLPLLSKLLKEKGVELRGDETACGIVSEMKPAEEDDWYEEYLDLKLAVRVVPSLQAAVEHINKYGSKHSDAIIAESKEAQNIFLREVDSATVYVNSSTRFTDGGEFGMGAEIGISTDKLHARGPMGLEELTTYKYLILGNGQIR